MHVAGERAREVMANEREECAPLHHAATQDQALGREHEDQAGQRGGDVARFQIPRGVIGRQCFGGLSPAALERGTGREAFPTAPAVKRAVTSERQVVRLARDEQMTHFRVHQAVRELTADQRAATDAGADRDVDRGLEISRGAPARFTEHGRVDVGVEADRAPKARRRSGPTMSALLQPGLGVVVT